MDDGGAKARLAGDAGRQGGDPATVPDPVDGELTLYQGGRIVEARGERLDGEVRLGVEGLDHLGQGLVRDA